MYELAVQIAARCQLLRSSACKTESHTHTHTHLSFSLSTYLSGSLLIFSRFVSRKIWFKSTWYYIPSPLKKHTFSVAAAGKPPTIESWHRIKSKCLVSRVADILLLWSFASALGLFWFVRLVLSVPSSTSTVLNPHGQPFTQIKIEHSVLHSTAIIEIAGWRERNFGRA